MCLSELCIQRILKSNLLLHDLVTSKFRIKIAVNSFYFFINAYNCGIYALDCNCLLKYVVFEEWTIMNENMYTIEFEVDILVIT